MEGSIAKRGSNGEGGYMTTSPRRRFWRYFSTYAFWALMTLITLIPIWWMLVVSMRTRVELFGRPNLMLSRIYLENYSNVLTDSTFQRYMTNSLVVSTANALLVMILALLATYALSRYKLAGRDNIFFWLITNRMAPPAAFLLPLYIMFTRTFRLGDWTLFDTQLGLILLYCVFNLPFAIWLLKGVVDGIPIELDDAAMIDGAGLWGVLRHVIIPLAAPGLAVTGILSWIFAWNEYLFAANLTSVVARTITTALAEFVTVTGTNWGELAAMSMVTLVPSAIIVIFAQRYIVMGLTFGAVKE